LRPEGLPRRACIHDPAFARNLLIFRRDASNTHAR